MSTVTFIGAGSFGTALSTIVAAKGCRVNIFDIDKAHLDRMEAAMENVDYLPGVKLSGDYHFYTDNDRYGTIDRVRKIINKIPDQTLPVYIHKNTFPGEKDFGVPADRMIESVMQLR